VSKLGENRLGFDWSVGSRTRRADNLEGNCCYQAISQPIVTEEDYLRYGLRGRDFPLQPESRGTYRRAGFGGGDFSCFPREIGCTLTPTEGSPL
jgi:hypothetical protein